MALEFYWDWSWYISNGFGALVSRSTCNLLSRYRRSISGTPVAPTGCLISSASTTGEPRPTSQVHPTSQRPQATYVLQGWLPNVHTTLPRCYAVMTIPGVDRLSMSHASIDGFEMPSWRFLTHQIKIVLGNSTQTLNYTFVVHWLSIFLNNSLAIIETRVIIRRNIDTDRITGVCCNL